jgi:hypothetical protein
MKKTKTILLFVLVGLLSGLPALCDAYQIDIQFSTPSDMRTTIYYKARVRHSGSDDWHYFNDGNWTPSGTAYSMNFKGLQIGHCFKEVEYMLQEVPSNYCYVSLSVPANTWISKSINRCRDTSLSVYLSQIADQNMKINCKIGVEIY